MKIRVTDFPAAFVSPSFGLDLHLTGSLQNLNPRFNSNCRLEKKNLRLFSLDTSEFRSKYKMYFESLGYIPIE